MKEPFAATSTGTGGAEIRTQDYDYFLPPDRIAQEPAIPRDASRLLILDRKGGPLHHLRFRDLPEILNPGDLVVLNDTRVFPARIEGWKPTGGRVEFLFLGRGPGEGMWRALCGATRELREGLTIEFGLSVRGEVRGRTGEEIHLAFPPGADVGELLDRSGQIPLPPYIHRRTDDPRREVDRARYQTVYARTRGAVAAPTAGLHFTSELLRRLEERGVRFAFLTLHVGPGTFLPVRDADARRHHLHPEAFQLPVATAAAVREARLRGSRVVATGTTVARVLEYAAARGEIRETEGECDLYILPGHRFACVDALITNFHLPRSTLLLLVAAFAGRERTLGAYQEAIARGYRFFSYGDAMLIL